MAELRVNTISNLAGTGPVTLTGQSAAKGWVSFNHQTVTILDDLNVSSLTDVGTGRLLVNFSNNFNAATFTAGGAGKFDNSNVNNLVPQIGIQRASTAVTTSLIDFSIGYYSSSAAWTLFDIGYGTSAMHGDLA